VWDPRRLAYKSLPRKKPLAQAGGFFLSDFPHLSKFPSPDFKLLVKSCPRASLSFRPQGGTCLSFRPIRADSSLRGNPQVSSASLLTLPPPSRPYRVNLCTTSNLHSASFENLPGSSPPSSSPSPSASERTPPSSLWFTPSCLNLFQSAILGLCTASATWTTAASMAAS